MIFGIGTDIFLMSRIAEQSITDGDPFLERAYTVKERDEAKRHGRPSIYYASRFSAKEAVYKSISKIGIEFRPRDIEILCDSDGRPHVYLYGDTEKILEQRTNNRYCIHVSISYDTDYCSSFSITETY